MQGLKLISESLFAKYFFSYFCFDVNFIVITRATIWMDIDRRWREWRTRLKDARNDVNVLNINSYITHIFHRIRRRCHSLEWHIWRWCDIYCIAVSYLQNLFLNGKKVRVLSDIYCIYVSHSVKFSHLFTKVNAHEQRHIIYHTLHHPLSQNPKSATGMEVIMLFDTSCE